MTVSRRTGALVIGSDYRSLGIVRSLGRHGIRVWVLCDGHRLAEWSRYCERSLPWPDHTDAAKLTYLLDIASRHGLDGWTLFPSEDETAALITRERGVLEARYRLSLLADWDTLRWAFDKRLTNQLATEVGVAHPRTWYPDRDEILRFAGPYPVILKPALSGTKSPLNVDKAWPAADPATLLARYDDACSSIEPSLVMLQELIPGAGEAQYSYAALCIAGRPVASLVARRTRQWPMDFGRASTYVETVDAPDVEDAATRLLSALRFSGLVEVEFKRDHRDGVVKLLDINPRIWGWHTLGRRAGVDFPYLLWRVLGGERPAPVRGRTGVRWVRGLTDLPTAITEMRARRLSPAAYLGSLRAPIEHAVFARDDPLPALLEVPATLALAWQRRRAAAAEARLAAVSA